MIVFWALSKASSWLCLSGSVGGTVCLLPNNLMMNKRTSIWSPAGLCVVCCYISQRPRIVDSMISELNPFCCDKPSVNRLLEPPRRSHDSFCDSRVSPEIMFKKVDPVCQHFESVLHCSSSLPQTLFCPCTALLRKQCGWVFSRVTRVCLTAHVRRTLGVHVVDCVAGSTRCRM